MCLYLISQTDKVLLFSEPLIWDKSNKKREFVQEKQIPKGNFKLACRPHSLTGLQRGQELGRAWDNWKLCWL